MPSITFVLRHRDQTISELGEGGPLIRGFEWEQGVIDDITLHADYVLIFLEDPEDAGLRALQILPIFGNYTGLTINIKKICGISTGHHLQGMGVD